MDEALKNLVSDFAKQTESKIRSRASRYGFAAKIKAKVTQRNGDLRLSYELPRYAVLRHKGVGKGRGINSGNTIPDTFLNDVLNAEVPTLVKAVAEYYQDAIINQSRILIQ
jgi:hypothetical protein